MDIIPWRPFGGELSSLRQEMDRLWDRFVGESLLEKGGGRKGRAPLAC
jgi:hypothetical protein